MKSNYATASGLKTTFTGSQEKIGIVLRVQTAKVDDRVNLIRILLYFYPSAERLNVLYERNWTMLVHEQLRRFELTIVAATRGRLGKSSELVDPSSAAGGRAGVEAAASSMDGHSWSFKEALLYSVTVITTIGKPQEQTSRLPFVVCRVNWSCFLSIRCCCDGFPFCSIRA